MTPAAFIRRFPEFAKTGPVLVAAKIDEAASMMGGPDVTVWGQPAAPGCAATIADTALGYLAADLVWNNPSGTATLLEKRAPGAKSRYLLAFEELQSAMCKGPLVAGGSLPALPGVNQSSALTPGNGTVSLVNGSPSITFAQPQTLAGGTLLCFVSVQPGILYVLAANITNSTTAALTAAYGGPTATNANWTY